jgi:cellulose synthase/poly-beta-1,6-N-acetylglucosamine synthase-like glycosyltransferase
MTVIAVLFGSFFLVLFVLVSLLLTQTICALPTWKGVAAAVAAGRPGVAILVPAHNEEQGIEATVQNIRRQLRQHDRILVVADNCSDATADAARRVGAEVCERTDLQQRGKGFALDFGVRHLENNPPEIVIIVDADCHLHDGAVDTLALAVQNSGRPAQAYYSMQAPHDSGPMKKIAEFAWMVKNYVRALGYKRLGLPCQLMGSGMAFSWPMISTAGLANGHVVEDLKLGMDLARTGCPAQYCPNAQVTSNFPVSTSGTTTQRARWEHGHMTMIAGTAPGLFIEAIRKRNLALFALTLDMCVPPIALLTLLVAAGFIAGGVAAWYADMAWSLYAAVILLFELTIAILLCWWRYGRQIISFRELLAAPWYVLRKIPLYLGFFIRRQVEWVRTQRDHE